MASRSDPTRVGVKPGGGVPPLNINTSSAAGIPTADPTSHGKSGVEHTLMSCYRTLMN